MNRNRFHWFKVDLYYNVNDTTFVTKQNPLKKKRPCTDTSNVRFA